jgi:hypothetical protein
VTGSRRGKNINAAPLTAAPVKEILGDDLFKWKHHALRHSFISCRVAGLRDGAWVSLEAGNRPQMILKRYRELMAPTHAKAGFVIK